MTLEQRNSPALEAAREIYARIAGLSLDSVSQHGGETLFTKSALTQDNKPARALFF